MRLYSVIELIDALTWIDHNLITHEELFDIIEECEVE